MPWYGLLLTGCGLADFCVTFAFFAMISLHPLLQRGCHRGRGRGCGRGRGKGVGVGLDKPTAGGTAGVVHVARVTLLAAVRCPKPPKEMRTLAANNL
jgi:hypothetical protein